MAARKPRKTTTKFSQGTSKTVLIDAKPLRPLLSDPIAKQVREYADKWGIPAQAFVNNVLAEYFEKSK